jgi:DNA gyrase/topoisomerase IV subunit B
MTRQAISEGLPDGEPLPIDLIRRRAGMYVGDTGVRGMIAALAEFLANSLDEHLAGEATFIDVRVARDGTVTVRDDGRGISLAPRATGETTLEAVFTTLHLRPTVDGHNPHVHVTRNQEGIGVGPVNALCETLTVETWWRGESARARFVRGVLQEPVEARPGGGRGTVISFRLDPAIFDERLAAPAIRPFLAGLAELTPKLTWRLQGRRVGDASGLPGIVVRLAKKKLFPGSIISVGGVVEGVQIEAALGLRTRPAEGPELKTWVNFAPTTETSSSDRRALREAVQRAYRGEWETLGRRLVAVMHLGLLDPRFEGPTRARLAVPEVAPIVSRFLKEELSKETDARIAWLELLHRAR